METKQCITCKETKSVSEFYFDKQDQRYQSSCKSCSSNRATKWIKTLSESNKPDDMIKSTIYKILQSARSNAKTKHISWELSLPILHSIYAK